MNLPAPQRDPGEILAPDDPRLAILARTIDFIDHESFDEFLAEVPLDTDLTPADPFVQQILDQSHTSQQITPARQSQPTQHAELPPHLRSICEADLLAPEEEAALFRHMNLLKYRASLLQAAVDRAAPPLATITTLEHLLAAATRLRDHLIRANTRLVISVIKQFVSPQQPFDDLLSDGLMILMQAVEKFDYDRGFRFSTYAYRSIARHAYRTVQTAEKEESR